MRIKQSIARIAFLVVCGLASASIASPSVSMAMRLTAANAPSQSGGSQQPLSADEKNLIATFNQHVKDYLKQRDRVRKKLRPLPKDATPEQISAYQNSFIEALRAMRAGTSQGYMFKPGFTEYVRTIIKTEFASADRAEIKQTILEAETKGVPLKVNYPYPATKELSQVPPTLLLKLPQLPREVKYRFVGRHMLLVDTDNGLIVDYTLNALP
jgi:ABC-type transporter MlaC component